MLSPTNYPIHYLVKDNNINNFKKLEILVYFHAKVNSLNSNNKRAIEITDDENVQQFLLKQEKNIASKETKNNKEPKKENEEITNKTNTNNLNTSTLSKLNMSQTLIDIDNIKYYIFDNFSHSTKF